MADWSDPPPYGPSFDQHLSPDHAAPRRPLASRRHHSRDSRDLPRPRRNSLHRDYYSDNDIAHDLPDERQARDPSNRVKSREVVPSPPRWHRLSDPKPTHHTRLPARPEDFGAFHDPQLRHKSDNRIPPPPAAWQSNISPVEDDFESSRLHHYVGTVPDPPLLRRRSPSPPNVVSSFRRPSPPPAIPHRRSSTRVVTVTEFQDRNGRRGSSPGVVYHPDASSDRPPGMMTYGQVRAASFEVPYHMPGGFPTHAPELLQPAAPQPDTHHHPHERRPWSRSSGSVAPSSPSRHSSTSGALGPKTYHYEPLGPKFGDSEFRLVRILPARMSSIKCEIFHASLEDPPLYTAVSYAWGDVDDQRKITVDGVSIPIAVSLHGALEALREKKEPVVCWVDFICIDQQNRDERTKQVQLMTRIYMSAFKVAIWLGPEADNSNLAIKLLEEMAANKDSERYIRALISSHAGRANVAAIVSLFERDYWRRLWVVQEVFNASEIMVHCGSLKTPWIVYRIAANIFWRHKGDLDHYFPSTANQLFGQRVSPNQFTYSQVLVYQGPSSLPDVGSLNGFGEESLLEVMRACRRKLSSDPKDKVFGVLGVLPEDIRNEFPVDYSLSVKEVYINVVDYLLSTTERLDVVRESIHFPMHVSSASLPSWVPDWSHIPDTTALRLPHFAAAGNTRAVCRLLDERRKLEISAVYVDTVSLRGISVGTLCTLSDYLMAFLHWRAILLASYEAEDTEKDEENALKAQEAFCRALCLDMIPKSGRFDAPLAWMTACYHVFASLIRERLPRMAMDSELKSYIDISRNKHGIDIPLDTRRRFLQEHFGAKMMGRCFCLTEEGRIGMGTGFIGIGDVIVVPLGCSTPIVLRPEGPRGEFRYVGDVYVHGWMSGKALREVDEKRRKVEKFVLH